MATKSRQERRKALSVKQRAAHLLRVSVPSWFESISGCGLRPSPPGRNPPSQRLIAQFTEPPRAKRGHTFGLSRRFSYSLDLNLQLKPARIIAHATRCLPATPAPPRTPHHPSNGGPLAQQVCNCPIRNFYGTSSRRTPCPNRILEFESLRHESPRDLKRFTSATLTLMGCTLVAAITTQIWQAAQHRDFIEPAPLSERLPTELPGWISREVPLAETAEGRSVVEGILRYDDYFSRLYRRGEIELTVYIAYWLPNKMPPKLIAQHTPDQCWTANGWTCEERASRVTFEGLSLLPSETGIYTHSRLGRLHVAFWHLVGGHPYHYGSDTIPFILLAPLKELLHFGANQRHEQYFIRLASNVPLSRVWQEPGGDLLLEKLAKLGLQGTL